MVVSYPIPIREGSEFPLDNIPFGIFSLSDSTIDGVGNWSSMYACQYAESATPG